VNSGEPLVHGGKGAAVFPRERVIFKIFVRVGNAIRRMTGNDFRTFIHPVDAIDAALRREGFEMRSMKETYGWRATVYSRPLSS
jgi:hypothetical protein